MTIQYGYVPDTAAKLTFDWVVRQFKKLQFAIGRGDQPATFVTPTSIDGGTLVGTTSSTVSDVQTMLDGNVYDIAESNGATPGLTVDFHFSGLEGFRGLALRSVYSGVSTHYVNIQLWDYNGAAFVTFHTLLYRSNGYDYLYMEFPDTENYIENGAAIVRFTHPSTGINTHHFFIDYLAITG